MSDLFDTLLRLGNVFELDFAFDLLALNAQLADLGSQWGNGIVCPTLEQCPALRPLTEHFGAELRSLRLQRFDKGGYLSPQRQDVIKAGCFQILCPVFSTANFIYMYGGERLHLEMGSVYFVNTLINHSVFSYMDGAILLTCDIELNSTAIHKLKSRLTER